MRANYQILLWKRTLEESITFPPPEEYGWQHDEKTLRLRLMTEHQVPEGACN